MENYNVRIDTEYLGDLHCSVTHSNTGQSFITDAPPDNQGKGEYISPTDLVAASIGSCIATIMGIVANNNNIDLKGMKISVLKEMVNVPYRRIGKLTVNIVYPHKLSDREFKLLENVTRTCPVTRSLSPDIEMQHLFSYAE